MTKPTIHPPTTSYGGLNDRGCINGASVLEQKFGKAASGKPANDAEPIDPVLAKHKEMIAWEDSLEI